MDAPIFEWLAQWLIPLPLTRPTRETGGGGLFGSPPEWMGGVGRSLFLLILGIILLVVGLGGASIAAGIIIYVLGVFNQTGIMIPSNYNFVKAVTSVIQTVALIAGILLLVFAAVEMVKYFWNLFGGGRR